jgi:hypothetical protein
MTWDFQFTSSLKVGVLQIFIALKYALHQPCLKPQTLGPMASTVTITPLR